MNTTAGLSARLPRLTFYVLLVLAIALMVAWPSAADAKKHSRATCQASHSKKHHAKRKHKRCPRHVSHGDAKKHTTTGGATPATAGGAGSTADTSEAPDPGEASRCQREQALDPAAFAAKYGVGPDNAEPLDTCELGPQDPGDDNSG